MRSHKVGVCLFVLLLLLAHCLAEEADDRKRGGKGKGKGGKKPRPGKNGKKPKPAATVDEELEKQLNRSIEDINAKMYELVTAIDLLPG